MSTNPLHSVENDFLNVQNGFKSDTFVIWMFILLIQLNLNFHNLVPLVEFTYISDV